MLDLKSPLIFGAVPGGLALACAGWLLFAAGGPAAKPLEAAEAGLAQLPAPRSAATSPSEPSASAGGDLFAAVPPPPVVRLDGISKTRRRTAALLTFGNGPAQWVSIGATVDGVTLVAVSDADATLETVAGREALALGQSTTPASPSQASASGPVGP